MLLLLFASLPQIQDLVKCRHPNVKGSRKLRRPPLPPVDRTRTPGPPYPLLSGRGGEETPSKIANQATYLGLALAECQLTGPKGAGDCGCVQSRRRSSLRLLHREGTCLHGALRCRAVAAAAQGRPRPVSDTAPTEQGRAEQSKTKALPSS